MSKKKRVLPKDYTVEELDRGEGMTYHPASLLSDTWPISELEYDPTNGKFWIPGMKKLMGNIWTKASRTKWGCMFQIGDGKSHKSGEPYLCHWTHDPFTGNALKRGSGKPLWEQD